MRWPRWVVPLVALVTVFVACTSTPAPSPTPTPSVTASAPSDTNPVPRDRVADGGMVRFPLAALPSAWNPWHALGATDEGRLVRAPLSEGAFTFDSAGRPSHNPSYVATVDVTHAAHTTVTLTLARQAVWSDGAAITADDWIATWRALSGDDPGFEVADDRGWRGVSSVRAGADDHEVVVDFAGVEPDWSRPLAGGPARAASVRDAATFNSGWPEYEAGWFSGPFVLGHLDRTQGVVTLDRNPLWWGEPPKLEHVVFRTIQPEALTAAFQHNEFDWVEVRTPTRLQQVRTATDTTIRTAPGTAGRLLRVDPTGVLGDTALRTALLQALDRTALATADLAGLTDQSIPWSNHLLLTTQPGYLDQAVATGLGHDRAAASAALTAAGWPLVEGHRARDGTILALTMAVSDADPRSLTEYDTLAPMLADLGISLTVSSDADLTPVTVQVDAYPLADVRGISDPALADLVERVATETDPVRRADQAAQLSRALWTQAASIPLYQQPQVVAVRNGLANLGAGGFASVRWSEVGWAR